MRTMLWTIKLTWFLCWTFIFLAVQTKSQDNESAKVVSQCYRARGFSFVSLYCGYNKIIQIQRAFHGAHKNRALGHCGRLEGDCITETTHHYDWSRCEGRHSCVQSITKRPMTGCTEEMVYLQVQYECVKGTALTLPASSTTPQTTRGSIEQTSTTSNWQPSSVDTGGPVMDICTNYTSYISSVEVTNPGYPQFYTSDTECRCIIKGMPNTKVAVTYQDLALVMRGGQCVDWLLLQSLGFKNSAAVTCGQMSGSEKTLMAKGNWLLLHFHTAHVSNQDNLSNLDYLGRVRRNMRGFKVRVTTKPEDKFEIQCHSTSPEVLSNLKYKDSQYDVNGNLLMSASDLNSIAVSSKAVRRSISQPLIIVLVYIITHTLWRCL